MKKLLALACLAGFALPASAEVYVVEDAAGDTPIVIQKDDPALGAVPEPHIGFSYVTKYVTTGTALRVHRGHVDPGGHIAVHDGPNVYVLYVISGDGKLVNVGADGEVTSEINYKPDDIIVFRENTMHYWDNGDEPFEFIGFEQFPTKD